MKLRVKVGITSIALALPATMVLGVSSASDTHQSSASAYAVSLGGSPGQPEAQYPEGPTSGGGAVPDQLGPLAAGGVLTVTAGNDHATAKVTNLTLGQAVAGLPDDLKNGVAQMAAACQVFDNAGGADAAVGPLNDAIDQVPGGIGDVVDLPTAEAASDFCNALLDADMLSLARVGTLLTECTDQTGSVTLTDVAVLGAEQPVLAGRVKPETQLLPDELAPVATITLNHQVSDGENFTVQGLRVEVGGQEVAVLGSTTCGGPIADHVSQGDRPAPAPKPVKRNAPVTG
jgi:hypothetical protein